MQENIHAMGRTEKEIISRQQEEIRSLQKKISTQETEIENLKNELAHDPLTGLKLAKNFEQKCLDRMAFVERKREESQRSLPEEHTPHRVGRTHSIAFVDMDGLKWTNDHPDFGYSVGDNVLIALADILDRWKRRQEDLVVRRTKGGDEFLVLFPGSDEIETRRILLLNRTRFENVISRDFPGLSGKVSFSFGVREVKPCQSIEEIALAFDEASKDMHSWKDRRKMGRDVSCLPGEKF